MPNEVWLNRKEASLLIAREKENILKAWENLTLLQVPAADKQTQSGLRDSLPKFIDQLEKTLRCDDPEGESEANAAVAREHGEDRAAQETYSLEEMINEYHLLRVVLLRTLETNGPFDLETNLILHAYVDRGVRKATIEYVSLEKEEKYRQTENFANELAIEKEKLDSTVQVLEQEKEMRERFVAALTHDLRTPLTSAKIGAQLIVKKPGSLQLVEATAKRIVGSMNRADQMIRDLLDANRIRAGEEFPMVFEACNLQEISKSVLNDLTAIYGARFEVKHPGEEIKGFWDKRGVVRIIENLASNAIKYGAAKTWVLINLSQVGDSVEISVHNHGLPIDPSNFEKIFHQFGRLSAAENGREIGWGVGLTLVKGIAEAHGGSVRVESAKEVGTTFFVKLPLDSRDKNNHG